MQVHRFEAVGEWLAPFAAALGSDRVGYRNHVCRVLNHYAAQAPDEGPISRPVLLAAAFHDLGIWTARTFDYLKPSVALALQQLRALGLEADAAEVRTLILQHHRVRSYRGAFERSVERFRRADWIDVSIGALRFGLPGPYLRDVRRAFPDAGFHCRLCVLAAGQFLRTPWRPLPMVRW
jgi:hypothetical protein